VTSLVERAVAARNRCYKDTIMSNFFEQAIDRGDDSGGATSKKSIKFLDQT